MTYIYISYIYTERKNN